MKLGVALSLAVLAAAASAQEDGVSEERVPTQTSLTAVICASILFPFLVL